MLCEYIPPNSLFGRMDLSENGMLLHEIKKQSEEICMEQTQEFLGGEFAMFRGGLWLAVWSAWGLSNK